jgi:hypothetical protein
MDAIKLIGSWNAVSGDSNLEFKADGTYIRVTRLDMPMTYTHLAIDDEGTYDVRDDIVRFTPTSGHYRRNGVDEGYDNKIREQRVRLETRADQSGYDLILDDGVWTKVVAQA